MAITELKIFKYECENCLHDWTMINPGKNWRTLEDAGYFCPYCGKKQLPDNMTLPYVDDNTPRKELDEATRMPMSAPIKLETEELPRFATDKESGFSTEELENLGHKTTPNIVQKGGKPVRILEAEDRITQARCTDGGWWNPITKKCQGEGVGHNVEELDNDPSL